MKIFLSLIFILVLIFIVILGVHFFVAKMSQQNVSSGSSSISPALFQTVETSSNQLQAQSTTTQISQAFITQTNANQIQIIPSTAFVVYPYALQEWGSTNGESGGEALLKFDPSQGWILLRNVGGAWDVSSLESEGVPASIAQQFMILLAQQR